jgi:predicted metal-dependent peptidase
MSDTQTALKKAHVRLMRHPETCLYGGIMLLGESTIEEGVPTAYTDGKNKRYGRQFFESLSMPEQSALVLHENGHVMLQHIPRHRDLIKENAKLANVAMDYVINDIIVEIGKKHPDLVKLPKGGLYDAKYHDWSVREVYNDLKQEMEKSKKGGGSGNKNPEHLKPLDEHDDKPTQEATPDDLRKLSVEINEAIQQGAMLAGKFGAKVPRVIKDLMEPKVSWRDELREFITSTTRGRDEYTWRKLNRRRMVDDIYLPTLEAEKVGEIVVAIDTSGSINGRQLDEFATELVAICDTVSPDKVRVLWWDTEVHGEQIFIDNYDGIAHMLKPQGGGGTKVSSVSEFINKENITADCVIVFTDGHLEDKVEWQVNSPTLWLVTMNKDFTAPSGRVVKMEV